MVDKTNSNSNDCLFDCKELVRERISSSCLDINCDDITNALREEIDIDKFSAWLERNTNTFKTKQNIHSYFKRAFIKELEKGTFKLEEKTYNANSLFQALRERGVKVAQDDTCYICVMWTAILKFIDIKDVQDLNHKIVEYMKKGQTSQDYINLVRKSKALKGYDIDWEKIQSVYEKELAEWHEVLNELARAGVENDD